MKIVSIEGRNPSPFSPPFRSAVDLSDKVVVGFGGAGNLGEYFLYGAAMSGAKIALIDYPPAGDERRERFEQKVTQIARNIADLGRNGLPTVLTADITDYDDTEAALSHVKKHFGRIDVAVDFAGISHPPFDLVKDDPAIMADQFRRTVEINLNGAFLFTVACARIMVPQRSGHIIHLCSSGSRLSLYATYGYNATKHGAEGLVKTAAAQLAHFGVQVNGIAPGTVETDLNRMLLRHENGSFKPRSKSILAHTPTKRFLDKEGIAETLLAMCAPQRHFTGNVVFADDGYNIEGHSWPEGNEALYAGADELDRLYRQLDVEYPRETE